MRISTGDLGIFCEVVRSLNLTLAAQALGVTPGHVSKRISALEAELGCRLFHRSPRSVTLTEQGERTYEHALRILDNAQALHESLAATRDEPRGVLRISTSFGFGRRVVSRALADFSSKYPTIEIRLDVVGRILDLVKHQIDLDIRVGDDIAPHYIARRLATNYRVLCAAPEYLARRSEPMEPSDLARHDCLLIKERDRPVGLWNLAHESQARTYNIKVQGPLVTNNGEIAVSWALAGRGVILRSIWDVLPLLRSGELVQVLPEYRQEANIWAVYPERLDSSARIKLCVRHLQKFFAQWQESEGISRSGQERANHFAQTDGS